MKICLKLKTPTLILVRILFTKSFPSPPPKKKKINLYLNFIEVPFLQYRDPTLLQKLQLLLQIFFRTLLAKKDSMIIAPGYEFMSYKNKKVSESFLGLNQKKTPFTL